MRDGLAIVPSDGDAVGVTDASVDARGIGCLEESEQVVPVLRPMVPD